MCTVEPRNIQLQSVTGMHGMGVLSTKMEVKRANAPRVQQWQ